MNKYPVYIVSKGRWENPMTAKFFLKDGVKAWEGTNKEIFKTENEAIVNFVYSSNLFRKVREAYLSKTN